MSENHLPASDLPGTGVSTYADRDCRLGDRPVVLPTERRNGSPRFRRKPSGNVMVARLLRKGAGSA
jgi:hypothetical protein